MASNRSISKPVSEPFSSEKVKGAKAEVTATVNVLVLGLLTVAVVSVVVVVVDSVDGALELLGLSPPQANKPRLIAKSRLGLKAVVFKKFISVPNIKRLDG